MVVKSHLILPDYPNLEGAFIHPTIQAEHHAGDVGSGKRNPTRGSWR
jgi:hypothetical protein